MKKWIFYILLIIGSKCQAQIDTLEIHYFKNGQVASIQYLENNRFGKAKAFKQSGELIFEQDIRRIGGHASVTFEYFENGAIRKADYSSAPDGGIQWYKSYSEFNVLGERTVFQEMSNDHLMNPIGPPNTVTKPPISTLEPKTAYHHRIIITNESRYTVILSIRMNGIMQTHLLEKQKLFEIEDLINSSEKNVDDLFSFTYSVPNVKGKKRNKLISFISDGKENKTTHLFTIKK